MASQGWPAGGIVRAHSDETGGGGISDRERKEAREDEIGIWSESDEV